MRFFSIKTHNFRNLANQEVVLKGKNIVLFGQNGQGKTNFLETVYLLCFGSSFRTKREREIIKQDENETALFGSYGDAKDSDNSIALSVKDGKKIIRHNGKVVKDRKELIQQIPCIIFAHDDIEFVKGPPEKRRWFFNQTISLYDLLYLDTLRKYNRVVKQRNVLLKERNYSFLETYDMQMAETGLEIQEKRSKAIQLFNTVFLSYFSRIAEIEKNMEIQYKPSWRNCQTEEDVLTFLKEKRKKEKEREVSSYGPHRDKVQFSVEGRDFSVFASTGQMRLMSLLLRIAQCAFFTERTGKQPILLIDDVLLELDAKKRKDVLLSMPEYNQGIYTFLPKEKELPWNNEKTQIFYVEKGVLTEREWKKQEIY